MAKTKKTKSIADLRKQFMNVYQTARQLDPNITVDNVFGRYVSSSPNQTTVNRLNAATATFNRYRKNMENSPKGRRLSQASTDAFRRYSEGEQVEKAYAEERNARYSQRVYMGLSNG